MATSIEQRLSKARRQAKRGDAQGAADIYRDVLSQFPQNRKALAGLHALTPTEAEMNALIALYTSSQYAQALIEGLALAERFPGSAFIPNLLGAVYAALGRVEEAVASYDKAIRLKPDYAEARNNLADSLNALGRADAAIATLTEALRIEPDFAEAHNNLGNALYLSGRIDEARASYERAIDLLPTYAEAHRNLSTVKKYTTEDSQFEAMHGLTNQASLPDRARMNLSFALAKAHDDLGQYDRAFEFLSTGNALQRASLPYSVDDDLALFDALQRAFDASGSAPHADDTTAEGDRTTPIFIVGMPRSGTTLVEQILASHSQVFGAGELERLGECVAASDWMRTGVTPAVLGAIRSDYVNHIRTLADEAAWVTDKLPLNFRWIGFICLALPNARIVHVARDARATCWSNYRHFFSSRGNRFSNDLGDVARYYRAYTALMRFWHARFPGRIYDLDYESLTENQEPETRELLAAVGLEWEPSCLQFHRTERVVETASATQVRQKMYTGSSAAWRHYEAHLGPMLQELDADRKGG